MLFVACLELGDNMKRNALRRLVRVLFVGWPLLTFLTPPAMAQGYCYRPSVPYCITSYSTYTDDFAFQSCRRNLQNYLSDVSSYVQCLQRLANDVNQEADDAVRRFNCRAAGNTICY